MGTAITKRRRQRAHASVFKVRRASLSDGRLPRLASAECRMSRAKASGTAAAHPSAAHVETSAPGSTGAQRLRSRFASLFIPRATRFATRRSRVRRTLAAEAKSWFKNAHNSTAWRCLRESLSSARSISGATRVHKSASGGKALRGLREIQCQSRRSLPIRFRHAMAVTWNSQPASTVCFRSLRARRARTRNTARVTSAAWSALPVRR